MFQCRVAGICGNVWENEGSEFCAALFASSVEFPFLIAAMLFGERLSVGSDSNFASRLFNLFSSIFTEFSTLVSTSV